MSNTTSPRPKFEFLDGLRGLSALYVAVFHTVLFTGVTGEKVPGVVKPLTFLTSFGYLSVAVFIVLSGFCLTIPIAVAGDQRLRGGFREYIKRRFRRIVPPYYAALILFIVLIAAVPILQTPQNTIWDSKIPVDWKAVLAHFLLVHNLHPDWINKIDGPMWSVATEWQIYFFFPLLLLVWRKSNLWWSVAVSLVIGLALAPLCSILHPWYLGLFGMGMASAVVAFSGEAFFVKLRQCINWRLAARVLTVAVLLFLLATAQKHFYVIVNEVIVATAVCVVLIHYTLLEKAHQPSPFVLRLLKSSVAVKLGVFSYSIYLVHTPIIALFNLLALHHPLFYGVRLCYMLLVALPVAIGCAYLFHLVFERRFMTGYAKKEIKQIPV